MKLPFVLVVAALNQNWKLADFEVHEIMETIDDIRKYQADRTESQSIGMITPALDSITNAIQQENPTLFKSSYVLLTNSNQSCINSHSLPSLS